MHTKRAVGDVAWSPFDDEDRIVVAFPSVPELRIFDLNDLQAGSRPNDLHVVASKGTLAISMSRSTYIRQTILHSADSWPISNNVDKKLCTSFKVGW